MVTLPSVKLAIDVDNAFGEQSLLADWTMAASGSFSYYDLSSITDYVVQAGDYLWYDVWAPSSMPSSNTHVLFELRSQAASAALGADTTALDQHGLDANNWSTAYAGRWYHREIALPTSWVGLTIDQYAVGVHGVTASGTYRARYRNVYISDSGGSTVRKAIWSQGATLPTLTHMFSGNASDSLSFSQGVIPITEYSWTDISEHLWSANIRRGRQHELDRTEAGTAQVRVNNSSRDYDPTYSAGPYTGALDPLTPLQITLTWNGTANPIFTGYLEAIQQIYALAALPEVELRAVDGFKVLSLSGLRGSTYAAENTETRFDNVLTAAGWSTVDRSSSGARSFQTSADFTSQDQNALEHLQAAVQAEGGRLYVRKDGVIRFEHRHAPYSATAVAFTFTEDHIAAIEFAYDDANIWNEINTQIAASGTLHTTGDSATSQALYLRRTLSRTGLPLDDNNEAEDLGGFLLTNYKDPALRITAITVRPQADATLLWPAVLDRELGDRVTVTYKPRAASAESISQESFIEGIEWTLARPGVMVPVLRLSPIGISFTLGTPWTLSTATDSTNGVIGTNTVLRF